MPKRKRKEEDGSKGKKKGVTKKGESRYKAQISTDGKCQALGTFDTLKEAAEAFDRAAIQAGRPISKLNFLDQVPLNYKPLPKKLRSDNRTGYRGVCKKVNRFQAEIFIDGRKRFLGTFDTKKEAAIAYDLAAIQAKRSDDLNFPDMIHVKKVIEEEGSKDNKVKFKGVQKSGKRFRAEFKVDNKRQHLGLFDTSKEAAEAHDRARIEAGHPTSKLNFQDKVPQIYNPKKKKLRPNNTIGYRGVSKKGKRFQAKIYIDGRRHHLGYFGTTKEAAIAYDLAAIQAKRPRSVNFPDMIHIGKKRKMMKSSNETSFNGVSKIGKKLKKFRARIYFDGKGKHLGSFAKARDAAMAYNTAIVE